MNSDDGIKDSTPELIDMAGTRFEAIARMGTNDADIVLVRTRMPAGKVIPLHSHDDP